MKNKILTTSLILMTVLIILAGLFMPKQILNGDKAKTLNIVQNAPNEYYSGTSKEMAVTASRQLSEFQKIQLISGAWQSEINEVPISETNISEYEIVNKAKDAIDNLYHKNYYPVTLSSSYDNWYSWSLKSYEAIDSTFNTYLSYCFVIEFIKYDNSEKHTILITENGTLLLAISEKNGNYFSGKSVLRAYNLQLPNITISDIVKLEDNKEVSEYSFIDYKKDYTTACTTIGSRGDTASYNMFQIKENNYYIIGIIPEEK